MSEKTVVDYNKSFKELISDLRTLRSDLLKVIVKVRANCW